MLFLFFVKIIYPTFDIKSFKVPSSSLAKASVCVTDVMWFKLNLKQKSSNSLAYV